MRSLTRHARHAVIIGSLLVGAALPAAAPAAAQSSACDLIAPFELSELIDAAFGQGTPTDTGCTWTTETRAGYAITITLDTTTDPPTVTITTDDAGVDRAATVEAVSALAAERLEQGTVAPTPFAGGGSSGEALDMCQVFSTEEIGALMDTQVRSYGGGRGCGWISLDNDRILVDVLVSLDPGDLSGGINGFPDAVEIEIAGLPGFSYGWETGSAETVYLTLDVGEGLLTVKVTSDRADIDADAVSRGLLDRALAATGHATGSEPSPALSPAA